jgi:hypothetical protein
MTGEHSVTLDSFASANTNVDERRAPYTHTAIITAAYNVYIRVDGNTSNSIRVAEKHVRALARVHVPNAQCTINAASDKPVHQ